MTEKNKPYKVELPDGNFVWEQKVARVVTIELPDGTIKPTTFTRTYHYDHSTERWKMKTEVRNLSRSNSVQEITKTFEEKPDRVEVHVSKLTHSGTTVIPEVKTECLTLGDYEAWDLKE
jgi:hypothetical protein